MSRQRKRVDCLDADEEERLLGAFDQLNRQGAGANYEFWAAVHFHCPHGNDLFLPWHRAYLYAFEDALRAASGDPSVTLPYWDWVALPKLPNIVNRDPLLRERYTDKTRPKDRRLPTAADVHETMQQRTFSIFGGAGECTGGATPGVLEDIHGYAHFWVGRIMEDPAYAAADPVFWLHHANVDRLWALWQRTNFDGPQCVDRPLAAMPPYNWRVRDVLTIDSPRLGYEYVVDSMRFEGGVLRTSGALQYPLPVPTRAAKVLVRLRNVHATTPGAIPAHIDVYIGRSETPVHRTSLFGVHPMSEHGGGHGSHHGSPHAQGFNPGFEVAVEDHMREGGIRFVPGLASGNAAAIAIDAVAIAFVD